MKKLYYSAFAYLIVGLLSGLFFREMTKLNGVFEQTSLGKVHGHILTLGFLMFIILMLLEKNFGITQSSTFSLFFIFYHIGVIVSYTVMTVRGVLTILEIKGSLNLSDGLDAAIAGMSGIGHIILSIALVMLMFILKGRLFPKKA